MSINADNDADPLALNGSNSPETDAPPLRLLVGLGDPEREQTLLPALSASREFMVVERCLAAEQLVVAAQCNGVDVALVAFDLHRLTVETLTELAQTGIPLVVLAPGHEPTWQNGPGVTIPLDADVATVEQALHGALRGERPRVPRPPSRPTSRDITTDELPASETMGVIAVASGHGSPGRTMLALNLAVALGAVAPTILVDADVAGPSLAAYLDADPTRNLYMLAHAEPARSGEWERALAQEVQPLGARSPQGVVLGGIPKPEMRTGVSARFFKRLIAELRSRYRYVILDVGADLLGDDMALHRTALGLADQLLFVASADLVGVWHARTGLGLLKRQLGVAPERVALVLNRYDRRFHHARSEIEWALATPAAAVIPDERPAVERAILAQRPLVLESRGRVTRAILDLAERVAGDRILLPPEPLANGHGRLSFRFPSAWRRWPWRRQTTVGTEGVPNGIDATSVH
ncbi:MAG TPA: hypothetical protein VNL16_14620 [Chloroflexota bacterium]|nr:hypothetical protein [Chloroflexota bacterium]